MSSLLINALSFCSLKEDSTLHWTPDALSYTELEIPSPSNGDFSKSRWSHASFHLSCVNMKTLIWKTLDSRYRRMYRVTSIRSESGGRIWTFKSFISLENSHSSESYKHLYEQDDVESDRN